jgi:hypothetical protein
MMRVSAAEKACSTWASAGMTSAWSSAEPAIGALSISAAVPAAHNMSLAVMRRYCQPARSRHAPHAYLLNKDAVLKDAAAAPAPAAPAQNARRQAVLPRYGSASSRLPAEVSQNPQRLAHRQKARSLLAEHAVGRRNHVFIGPSFTTICQAHALDS